MGSLSKSKLWFVFALQKRNFTKHKHGLYRLYFERKLRPFGVLLDPTSPFALLLGFTT